MKSKIVAMGMALTAPMVFAKVTAYDKPVPAEVMLWAIAQVETGDDNSKIGRAGERSRWQLGMAEWYSHTGENFAYATFNPVLARQIAGQHLERLTTLLLKRGLLPTPSRLYRKWNPHASEETVQRIVNLCADPVIQTAMMEAGQ
jgi:hypothetical protein